MILKTRWFLTDTVSNSHLGEHCRGKRGEGESDGIMLFIQKFAFARKRVLKNACLYSLYACARTGRCMGGRGRLKRRLKT